MFSLFKKPVADLTDVNAAIQCFKKRDFNEALRRADAIIESSPMVAMSHRFRGEVLFEMTRYSECQEAFLRAEEIGGPGTEECFFWRALAAANGGNPNIAVAILQGYIASTNASAGMISKCRAAIAQLKTA